jgi:hypothetical protein
MEHSSPDIPREDKEIRCPRLGGPVNFQYCRNERGDRPCHRALTCWQSLFDAESYFLGIMDKEDFETCFFSEQPTRMESLLTLIEQAKRVSQAKKPD